MRCLSCEECIIGRMNDTQLCSDPVFIATERIKVLSQVIELKLHVQVAYSMSRCFQFGEDSATFDQSTYLSLNAVTVVCSVGLTRVVSCAFYTCIY